MRSNAHPARPAPALLAALGLAVVLAPSAARAAPTETYIFAVSRVELAKGVPAELEAQVSARVARAIEAHAELEGALPAGTPDPEARPAEFKAYLKKRRQRAFKVNVEVTEYESAVATGTRGGNVLSVRVGLRVFGETIPDRVMAFTGDGSAGIKIEIGKKLRDKDKVYGNDQALELAVADALAVSIKKLREPPPSQKKRTKPRR